jgi:hypothetical protein
MRPVVALLLVALLRTACRAESDPRGAPKSEEEARESQDGVSAVSSYAYDASNVGTRQASASALQEVEAVANGSLAAAATSQSEGANVASTGTITQARLFY